MFSFGDQRIVVINSVHIFGKLILNHNIHFKWSYLEFVVTVTNSKLPDEFQKTLFIRVHTI
jgi:hypothetical protein